jgi:hypothetical protein
MIENAELIDAIITAERSLLNDHLYKAQLMADDKIKLAFTHVVNGRDLKSSIAFGVRAKFVLHTEIPNPEAPELPL